jgi:hypothetical protein
VRRPSSCKPAGQARGSGCSGSIAFFFDPDLLFIAADLLSSVVQDLDLFITLRVVAAGALKATTPALVNNC